LVTRVDDNAAAIINEQNARTTALLAEATARETLAAQLKTDGQLYASGLVTSEANVRAAQDQVLGERIDLVSAEVGGISTAILNEQTARITGDEVEATSRKALSTKLFGTDVIDGITVDTLTSGFLYDQRQSIITQTESVVTAATGQIAQIQTDLTNTKADLLTETTTRVNEYGAIATSVTALSTEFNNQKATLDSLNSIVSGPDGITTQWGIKSDINGYITGVGLISSSKYGTPTSQFIVYADQFALVTPGVNGGAPTVPFFVGSEQGYLELSNTVKSNWNNITGSNKPADNATRNVFRGDWAGSASYVVGDIVLKDGNGWSCILAHTSSSGNQPPVSGSGNAWWTLYAVKGSDGAQGLHALTVLVPNDSHTLPASSDGIVSSYTNSGTTIQVFEGTTALTAVSSITGNGQFTIGLPTQSPVSTLTVGARSYSVTTATVAQHSAMVNTTDSVVITYPIIVRTSNGTNVTLSATQTITKSKAGVNASPVYSLIKSENIIIRDAKGVYITPTINFSAQKKESSAVTPYFGRFIVLTSSDGINFINRYVSSSDEASLQYNLIPDIKTVRIRLYESGDTAKLLDEETIPVIEEPAEYNVQIESVNGTVFRVGQGRSTLLIAHVFRNGVEITDEIAAERFRWERVSIIPQPPPFDDASWNASYISGYKQILVTVDDVYSKATFHCRITQ